MTKGLNRVFRITAFCCCCFFKFYTASQPFWNWVCNISDDPWEFTFSYFAKPPMTAGSTMPLSSMERGLIGRLQSDWYWLIIVKIFSFVDSMVSMAFSKGDKVVWKGRQTHRKSRRKRNEGGWMESFQIGCGRRIIKPLNIKRKKPPVISGVEMWNALHWR